MKNDLCVFTIKCFFFISVYKNKKRNKTSTAGKKNKKKGAYLRYTIFLKWKSIFIRGTVFIRAGTYVLGSALNKCYPLLLLLLLLLVVTCCNS